MVIWILLHDKFSMNTCSLHLSIHLIAIPRPGARRMEGGGQLLAVTLEALKWPMSHTCQVFNWQGEAETECPRANSAA